MERSSEIPEHLKEQIEHTELLMHEFLTGLKFISDDTARDPGYMDSHMLSYAAQDYLQSAIALPMLVQEGIHNVGRRELRFILEMSIKICRIQQQEYRTKIAEKLDQLKATIDSTNISMQKQLDLSLLPEGQRPAFIEEVGRLYGQTSGYVHWSTAQILERIAMVDDGRFAGKESAEDIQSFNQLIARGMAASLVFLFHSVPQYVAGDLLVQSDGDSLVWSFSASQYIAHIDEHFDYKHERQANLDDIKKRRWAVVTY